MTDVHLSSAHRLDGLLAAASVLLAASMMACGLSAAGAGAATDLDGGTAGVDGSFSLDGTAAPDARDASADAGSPADAPDAGGDADAGQPAVCSPFDAGIEGPLALSAFSVKGTANYNENNDGKITLTDSINSQSGAAWYPTQMPVLGGYDLSWTFRVGPNNTAGDGMTFAVLQSTTMPDVGDDGDGVGLRNIFGANPGTRSGYAVEVDMYQNASDPTDLGPTTLKIITMPKFTVVAKAAVAFNLNDGSVFRVDVSWRAPSTLTATFHAPGGGTIVVTSSDPSLTTTAPAFFGFTGATGGASNSHNEIAGITVDSTCR